MLITDLQQSRSLVTFINNSDSAAKCHAQLQGYSADEEGAVMKCVGANQSTPRNRSDIYFSICKYNFEVPFISTNKM
jgi:hypothetical protein